MVVEQALKPFISKRQAPRLTAKPGQGLAAQIFAAQQKILRRKFAAGLFGGFVYSFGQ